MIGKLKKRIVLIEEDDKLREGLSFTIERSGAYSLVNSYKFYSDAVKQVHRDCPNLVIIDIAVSDMDGVEGIRTLKSRYPADIIVFTEVDSPQVINDVLSLGICGYILKDIALPEFIHSLELIVNGGAVLSPSIAKTVLEFFHLNPYTPLSSRETDVLKLITRGKTYSEIASELNIAVETSKTHIRNIYKKLNVNSKSEAVRKALNDKLVSVGVD
ncbi:response regulator transcription factor [Ohtaekwangia koreensis]|uniref:Two component transcriptional regulator, LuxR family n=1 Tax=Ohtaekwangia koreensis TaxID=688867 RepID=A0A1T5MDV8_9BACT|nr:response regulator transcription factor [Ohtaekwangia koreensis]SKC86088.1 two component transcriptional regulator, LuxR family [Ohtaekwangia koreensis]